MNNAGLTRDAMIHKMTDIQWDSCVAINLKGPFNCIRAASKYMMQEGHVGRIVNIASIAGLMGNIGQVNYSAAKAGIIGLTKAVAKDWSRWGVTCNAVAYGGVDTRLTGDKETSEEIMGEKVGVPKKLRGMALAQMEQQGIRYMTPEEAAKPVLFLVSDEGAFITGHAMNVSWGLYI